MSVRAFCDQPPEPATTVVLSRDESHYVVRVRRLREGQPLELLGREGGGWAATLVEADAKRARVDVLHPLDARPPRDFDLGVGLIETRAAYDAVARACEAGARSLTWVHTARSLNTTLKADRIERVITAARRQCGRLEPMPVHGPLPLESWISQRDPGFAALVHHQAQHVPPTPAKRPETILIGPEGGWQASEAAALLDAHWVPLRLGPYVLRTEVAIVAALAHADR